LLTVNTVKFFGVKEVLLLSITVLITFVCNKAAKQNSEEYIMIIRVDEQFKIGLTKRNKKNSFTELLFYWDEW